MVRSKPFDLEPRIEIGADLFQRRDEIGQAFQRVILALHWNHHRYRRPPDH
jgi:hypothetical protein